MWWRNAWLGLWLVAIGAGAQGRFTDPQDGYFDLSDHLLQQKGFMPVPIIITEPALDYGGGLGALWFSESLGEAKHKSGDGPMVPPSIGGLFAFKSGNGSWGAGGGYFMPLAEDRYRYLGGAGKLSLNLDYYLPISDEAAAYQLAGSGVIQQLLARVGRSNWWLGPRYIYLSCESSFAHQPPAAVPSRDLDMQIGQLSLIVDYDSRDNMLLPVRVVLWRRSWPRSAIGWGPVWRTTRWWCAAFIISRSPQGGSLDCGPMVAGLVRRPPSLPNPISACEGCR